MATNTPLQLLSDKGLPSKYRARLPKGIELKWAAEAEHAKQLITKNKDLKACTTDSIQGALLNAAMIGLSLNPKLGHAYLIPRKVYKKKADGSRGELHSINAELYVSYRGMNAIATRSKSIKWVKAVIVYKNEIFSIDEGISTSIRHKVITDPDKRGDMVGVYCVAMTQDRDHLVTFMDYKQIAKVRACSENPTGKYSPWENWTEEMWKKSVIRRAWKTWPTSNALEHAINTINTIEEPAERPVEAVRLINDKQVNKLHATVSDALPDADAAKWVTRLVRSFGYESASQVPHDKYSEVVETLDKAIQEKINASST